MKWIKVILFVLIMNFIFIPSVNAESYGYYLKSSSDGKALTAGDELIVQGVVNSAEGITGKITGGKLTMRYDSNIFELVEYSKDGSEEMYSTEHSSFNNIVVESVQFRSNIYDNTETEYKISTTFSIPTDSNDFLVPGNEYIILEYALRVKDSVKSGQTVIYSADDEDYLSCYDEEYGYDDFCAYNYGNKIKININGKDDNTNLSELSINDLNISPKFNKDITEYKATASYEVDKVTINATCEGKNCTVEGAGQKNLILGKNTFEIKVTSEDKKQKVYTIVIDRLESSSNNNSIDTPIPEDEVPQTGTISIISFIVVGTIGGIALYLTNRRDKYKKI